VLAFLSLIAGRITTNKVAINFTMKMIDLYENQVAFVNGLLQMFRERLTTIHSIHFSSGLSSIQFLPDVDNKMENIHCIGMEESEIPSLMALLASPRADGKQRVMKILIGSRELAMAQNLLDALKEVVGKSALSPRRVIKLKNFHLENFFLTYSLPRSTNIPFINFHKNLLLSLEETQEFCPKIHIWGHVPN
jgi:hypothetical protein